MRQIHPVWGALFLFLIASASAIYEEQAGGFDWLQQHVGEITLAKFAARNQLKLYVASTSNAIAALNLRDGSLAWRRVLDDKDNIIDVALLTKPSAFVTLSSGGKMLRAWSTGDGGLLWEKAVHSGDVGQFEVRAGALALLPESVKDGSSLAVVVGSSVKAFSGTNGRPLWTASLSPVGVSGSLLFTSGEDLVGIGILPGRMGMKVVTIKPADGSVTSSALFDSSVELGSGIALKEGVVALLSQDGLQLCSAAIAESSELVCQSVATLAPALAGPVTILGSQSGQALTLLGASGVALLKPAKSGFSLAAFFKGATAVTNALLAGEKDAPEVVGISGATPKGGAVTKIVSAASGEVLAKEEVPELSKGTVGEASSGIRAAFLGSFRRTDGSTGYRVALVAEDHTLALSQQGQLVWGRPEALGSIVGATFVDLHAPTPEHLAEYQAAAPSLSDRFHAQILKLKEQLGLLVEEGEKATLLRLQQALSEKLLPTADANGFRKMIVALSKSGVLFGLHSGDGHTVWSRRYDPTHAPQMILPWRASHDTAHAPELLILHSCASTTYASIINGLTGQELSRTYFPFHVTKVVELPARLHEGTTDQRLYLLVGEGASPIAVQPFPSTSEALATFQELSSSAYFWTQDKTQGLLVGYGFQGTPPQPVKLWQDSLAGPGEEVLALVPRNFFEAVNSYPKVLGDLSLKLKYLNPNAVFVAVGPPADALTEDVADSDLALTVQIIDTVTGRPIFRRTHRGARGPVSAVYSEHWVVYHFFDVVHMRFEMAVVEMYEQGASELTPWALAFHPRNDTHSSFEPAPLEFLSEQFFVPTGLRTLGVTSTGQGITSKMLLLGTASDQVYVLDKKLLDPRRPKGKPTAYDQAELLIPYDPEIGFAPQAYATHALQVAKISGIVTASATLESTSLMLAWGLDVFFTRVTPSKSFDSLSDDFPYALLMLLVLVMAAATAVLKVLDDRAALKQKWH